MKIAESRDIKWKRKLNVDTDKVIEKGRLGPCQMVAVDFLQNKILRNWEVKSEAAKRENYQKLLHERIVKLKKN